MEITKNEHDRHRDMSGNHPKQAKRDFGVVQHSNGCDVGLGHRGQGGKVKCF